MKLYQDKDKIVFDSWGSYLDSIEEKPLNSRALNTTACRPGKRDWNGNTEDLGDALTLARTGWTDPLLIVDRFIDRIEKTVDTEITQTAFEAVYGVSGAEVDVALYLSGEPECMIESTPIRVSRHGRAVRLVVGASMLAEVKPEAFQLRGAAVVALADILAKAQHPLEVWWHNSAEDRRGTFTQLVKVQAATDPLDIPRLLFAFGHPASNRRIGFRGRDLWGTDKIGFGNYGGTAKAKAEDLLDHTENDIVLQPISRTTTKWTEDTWSTWIEEQLAAIFD